MCSAHVFPGHVAPPCRTRAALTLAHPLPPTFLLLADHMAAQAHKAAGNAALAAKDFDKAIEEYTKAIEADPTDHVSFLERPAQLAHDCRVTPPLPTITIATTTTMQTH